MKAQKGFSLIELLIAMSFFGIGILSLISIQLDAMRESSDSLIRDQAIYFASSKQEILYLQTLATNNAQELPNHIYPLKEKWLEDLKTQIPKARFVQDQKDGRLIVLISWPSLSEKNECQDKSLKLNQAYEHFDCLRI